MKKGANKLTALTLAVLTFALMTAGELCEVVNIDKAYADTSSEADQLTEAAESLLGSVGKDSSSVKEGKEETVYVITEPDGTPKETIVSAWLKNPDGEDTLKDNAELEDIENVKGDETFTKGENGEVVWNANGSDIYYQGKTNKELPVETAISYELDGKKISSEDVAGATGHLKITFTYKNNISETKVIDGKNVTLYEPFLVISDCFWMTPRYPALQSQTVK